MFCSEKYFLAEVFRYSSQVDKVSCHKLKYTINCINIVCVFKESLSKQIFNSNIYLQIRRNLYAYILGGPRKYRIYSIFALLQTGCVSFCTLLCSVFALLQIGCVSFCSFLGLPKNLEFENLG